VKRLLSLLLILGACLPIAPASEAQTDERLDAAYPEGPLVVGDEVLFAEMNADRITAWGPQGARIFYDSAGCGPTALAPYAGGYAVLCHRRDEIHLVSPAGRFRKSLNRDSQGRTFNNPNDATADGAGGVYFTASGEFDSAEQPKGALLYLGADGVILRRADKLDYANGIHFDRHTELLYVTEHLGGRILTYPVLAPGVLGKPAVFFNFADHPIPPINGYDRAGPDGLETDGSGNLYVAMCGTGKLIIISPSGDITRVLGGFEPLITNIALASEARTLNLTASEFEAERPGAVHRLVNPLSPE